MVTSKAVKFPTLSGMTSDLRISAEILYVR